MAEFKQKDISEYMRESMALAGLRNSYAIVRAGIVDPGASCPEGNGNAAKRGARAEVMEVERVPSASLIQFGFCVHPTQIDSETPHVPRSHAVFITCAFADAHSTTNGLSAQLYSLQLHEHPITEDFARGKLKPGGQRDTRTADEMLLSSTTLKFVGAQSGKRLACVTAAITARALRVNHSTQEDVGADVQVADAGGECAARSQRNHSVRTTGGPFSTRAWCRILSRIVAL